LPDDGGVVGRLVANRYLIEEPCERTATSAIYRARQLGTERSVLLRVLPERTRLTRERCRGALALAERAAALPSPHIARTLDVGVVAERWPFLVFEYSKGRTLAAGLVADGPLALRRIVPIARQLASVLGMAHAARVRHGDLRLDGVWVESLSGRPDWVRMFDFGVSELPEDAVETSRSGVFQRSTRRPEPGAAFSREAVGWDLQSLGSALYELALGSALGARSQDVGALLESKLPGLALGGERALVRGLGTVIERCSSALQVNGYQAMEDVSRDLEILAQTAAAIGPRSIERRPPVTAIHAPARRAQVALGGPKVIVRG
jgi:serine/threonine protein kinase